MTPANSTLIIASLASALLPPSLARLTANTVTVRPVVASHAEAEVRPAQTELVSACGLDWERTTAGRTTFRGFNEGCLVALPRAA